MRHDIPTILKYLPTDYLLIIKRKMDTILKKWPKSASLVMEQIDFMYLQMWHIKKVQYHLCSTLARNR